jgi:SIR2-like protein
MTLSHQLINDLKRGRLILFVGAGLSGVLKLPNWAGLINTMAAELGFDPELFQMLGNLPTLAQYYLMHGKTRGDLARWLDEEWHADSIDISTSTAHEAIVRTHFPVIYTTNYDHWLERAHDFHKVAHSTIIRGDDIADARDDVVHIVKFHGDLADPGSMVLTETDYFERLRFESALDLKLRADLFRYSVLFVGCSLSDVNIRNILYRLALHRRTFRTTSAEKLRSYMFVGRQNEVQAATLQEWGIETIVSDELDRTKGIESFLALIEAGSHV